MRTLPAACAVSAAAVSLLLAPAAYATPPGDNGTVKIHDAATGEELRKNEPHVCTFYLDAFGFDGRQQADWKIVEMPPTGTKGAEAKSGAITLDDKGHGRSTDLSLPDGHYKLIWNFDGEHGKAKHKVFWTDCEGKDEDGATTAPSASASTSAGPSAKPSTPATPSESGSAAAPGASPSASAEAEDGNLAETGAGSAVWVIGGAAAALLVGGGLLVRRMSRG
ncbi:hypothetical protein ACQUSR_11960 [Streptomyces sp. P1-3]|uniref:hypothetical protein n=1 Tax=Streptomyces sp. P1-3 TaxID=3421658 RepID=UPI003D36E626